MNLQFKNPDGGLTPALQERVERKLAKYSRFTDSPESRANTYFEIERAIGSHQTGNVWRAAINIDVDGERYHAEAMDDAPEKAATKALKEIRGELRKSRGRQQALVRRGGSFFKSLGRRLAER